MKLKKIVSCAALCALLLSGGFAKEKSNLLNEMREFANTYHQGVKDVTAVCFRPDIILSPTGRPSLALGPMDFQNMSQYDDRVAMYDKLMKMRSLKIALDVDMFKDLEKSDIQYTKGCLYDDDNQIRGNVIKGRANMVERLDKYISDFKFIDTNVSGFSCVYSFDTEIMKTKYPKQFQRGLDQMLTQRLCLGFPEFKMVTSYVKEGDIPLIEFPLIRPSSLGCFSFRFDDESKACTAMFGLSASSNSESMME